MNAKQIILIMLLALTLHSCGVYYAPRGAYYSRRNFVPVYNVPVRVVRHFYGTPRFYGGHRHIHYGGGRR
ncbi:MAG: hypothetical protein WCJ62_08000 [Flavobacterium sp.]